MTWIQNILLSLCTAGIGFCVHFLWDINAYMQSTKIVDQSQDNRIELLSSSLDRERDNNNSNLGRIIHIEAILPDTKIKIIKP